MHKLSLLVVCSLSTIGFADPHAHMTPGTYPEKAAVWKKLTLQDVMLGSELSKVRGFTCGPDPETYGFTTYRHTCVKFVDKRCAGKPTKIRHIAFTGQIPEGQSCFMDEGSGATYFDRKFTSPPLFSVSIVGTDTTVPRVYEITYTFAKDVLDVDSNLGKALIAKYGKPTSVNAPISMSWSMDGAQVYAGCGTTEGPTGEFCTVRVSDDNLLETERSIQQEADAARQKKEAPPAPKL